MNDKITFTIQIVNNFFKKVLFLIDLATTILTLKAWSHLKEQHFVAKFIDSTDH